MNTLNKSNSNNKIKILLVEDNPDDANLIQTLAHRFKRLESEMITTQRISDALQKLEENTFDIIVTDLNLPDSNGINTFSALHEACTHIPIIVLSGLEDEKTGLNMMKHGAQEYLTKDNITRDTLERTLLYAIERKRNEQKIRENENKLNTVFSVTQAGIVVVNAKNHKIENINKAALELTGFKEEELLGKICCDIICINSPECCPVEAAGGSISNRECELLKSNGKTITVIKSASLFNHDGTEFYVETFIDISGQKRIEEELRIANDKLQSQMQIDPLTGLLSRRYGLKILDEEVIRNNRYENGLSLLLIDIDDFKNINDNYGHAAGDKALQAVSQAISSCIRNTDKVVRYGGDEFIVILPNSDEKAALAVCQKLQDMDTRCKISENKEERLSISIGCSFLQKNMTSTELIDSADLAMLIAKKHGKGRFHAANTTAKDDNNLSSMKELLATRKSMREVLSRTFGALLSQINRNDDLLFSRIDLMLSLGELFAEETKLNSSDSLTLKNAIRLSNFEQINLCSEIANKGTSLSHEQKKVLKQTFSENLKLLEETRFLQEEVEVLKHIHEWHNGTGFPEGKSSNEIPLLSRMLAILSAFSVIYEGGSHTEHFSHDNSLRLLEEENGTHFDPSLLTAFKNVINKYYSDNHDCKYGNILLVEDHPPIAKILSKHLTNAGYLVTISENIEKARTLIQESKWKAILLDLMLPDGSGLDFLAEIKNNEKIKSTPVAIVSSRFDNEAIKKAKDLGAFCYAVKPIRFEKFLRALARCDNPSLEEFNVISHNV